MGFGCNVPAIMATRNIQGRNNRIITILINPFMSCSARLPVYILFIAAFFPKYGSLVLMGMYAIGILLAVVFARLFRRFFFQEEELHGKMALPNYHLPPFRTVLKDMWGKGKEYVKKMGGIILIASIAIWFLGYFPQNSQEVDAMNEEITALESSYSTSLSAYDKNTSEYDELKSALDDNLSSLVVLRDATQQENSFIGRIGKTIEPVLKPLGFNWKIGVSIVTGIAAKELVISTLGVLYQLAPENESYRSAFITALKEDEWTGTDSNSKVFTPLVAFNLMLFVLIYFPCIAVVTAIKNETKSWWWAMFSVFYTTFTAWLLCLIVYQVGRFLF
jgi:ferrous iron transport protein B